MTNKLPLIIGVACTVAMAAGGAVGYFVAQKQLTIKYEEIAKKEIAEAKDFYRVLYKRDGFETPQAAAEKLAPEQKENEYSSDPRVAAAAAKVLTEYGGHFPGTKPPLESLSNTHKVEETTISRNVFIQAEIEEQNLTDEDWKQELMNRTEEAPYVLSKEEFMLNDSDYTQVTLTYYKGDETLADDQDNRIDTPDEVVGLYNLNRFGHWSSDPRIVYIRNDVRDLEAEIILHDDKYSAVVQGFTE